MKPEDESQNECKNPTTTGPGKGHPIPLAPLDDTYGLPLAPSQGHPVSAPMFDALLAAAEDGGMWKVWRVWSGGQYVTETPSDGRTRTRPARRATLLQFLKRRPDLHALLSERCDERTSRLVNELENRVEAIALDEDGDRTEEYNRTGDLMRVRIDRRNSLRAAEFLLRTHAADTYSEKRRLEVSGSVDHNHAPAVGSGFVLKADDIARLKPAEQQQLFALLGRVHELQQADPDRPKRELVDEPAKQSLSQGDRV